MKKELLVSCVVASLLVGAASVPSVAHAADGSPGLFSKITSFFGGNKTPSNGIPMPPPLPVMPPMPAAQPPAAGSHTPASMPRVMMPPMPGMENASKEDAKNLDAAKKVVKLFGLKTRVRSIMQGGLMFPFPILMQENPGKEAKVQKVLEDVVDKAADAHTEEVEKESAMMYAHFFTAAELEQLKTFYESTAGQKMMKVGVEISGREGMYAQNIAMASSQQVREDLIKAMKKNDLKVPKALGGS